MALPKGLKVSINNTPQGNDDDENWGESVAGTTQTIDVLSNDLGGGSTTLLGLWNSALPLDPDELETSITGSGTGATISIENNQLTYDFSAFDADHYDSLAQDEEISDTFYYVLRMGSGALAIAKVEVTINGENDPPVITSDGGGETAEVSVPENTSVVTTVVATDPDNGATRTYTIVGGADSDAFSINALTGELSFVSAPDYELPTDSGADNSYEVEVQVSDEHGATDVQAITVAVTNVDEGTGTDPLFTDDPDNVQFASVVAGSYADGTQYDGLDGNDNVVLPKSQAEADAAGYDASETFRGGSGDDFITASGGGVAVSIDGGEGNDILVGSDVDDLILGGVGDDAIGGGFGEDTVDGGAGFDSISIFLAAPDVLDGGADIDTLTPFGLGLGTVVVDLGSITDQLVSVGGIPEPLAQTNFENLNGSITDAVMVSGSDGENFILGSLNADTIDGAGGPDIINGFFGNDILTGGEGADNLIGGEGDDNINGEAGNDLINVGDTGGEDVIEFGAVLDILDVFSNGTDFVTNFDGDPVGGQDMIDLDALFDSLNVADGDRAGRYTVSAGTDLNIDLDGADGTFEYTIATVTTAGGSVFDILDVTPGTL